jgi:parvulin-like peptidyl-prolyl isomerase
VQQRINDLDNALKAKGKTLQQYYLDTGQSESRIKTDIAAVVQWNAYTKKHITEDQVKKYYEENRELFDGVMIRASHIFLKVAKDAEPSAQQAARQKLQAVRQEIAKGLDFAEAAKKHGQDAAAANGGDLGYFPSARNDADPFLRTVSVMKAGQVSDVVQTDYGFHLIKVTDRKSGKPSSFEECQEDARILVAEELRLSIIDQERKKAKIEISLP